jgi:hypothetical protein
MKSGVAFGCKGSIDKRGLTGLLFDGKPAIKNTY